MRRTDKEIGCVETAHDSIVWTLAWHPLGHILCSGSNDHTIKFWTRNRPGDLMRDKYNLNTLPASLAALDDCEYDDAIIPGMGPEDKVEFTESLTADKGFIPGLELDPSSNASRDQEKKVPYSKPIPRNFQAQWAGSRRPDEMEEDTMYTPRERRSDAGGLTPQQLSENAIEGMLASGVLTTMDPQAIVGILVYGRFIRVHPDSRLMLAVRQGPDYLNKYIDAGKLEELRDVVPVREHSRSVSPTLEGRESSPPSKKPRSEARQHHPQAVFVKQLLSLKKPFLPCLLNLAQSSQPNEEARNDTNSNQKASGNAAGPWANNNGPRNNNAAANNSSQNGFKNNSNNFKNNSSNNHNSRNSSPSFNQSSSNKGGDNFGHSKSHNQNNNNSSHQSSNRRNRRGGGNRNNEGGGRNRGNRRRF